MGLTVHYALHAGIRSPKRAKELLEQLRSKALDLPFKEVGNSRTGSAATSKRPS